MQTLTPTGTAATPTADGSPGRPSPDVPRTELPHLRPDDRVRLLPHLTVLRRDDRDIQVGVDADDAIVLADPDGSVATLLRLMDGRCRLSDLPALAEQHAISAERASDLISTLAECGLLQHPD